MCIILYIIMIHIYIFSLKNLVPPKTYLVIFMMIIRRCACVVCLLYVTTSQIIFSLNSSLDSPHLISEAQDESRHRRPYRHRRSRHRRWSYRRENLSETDSRSSRLRGSMLLPNSTKVGDRQWIGHYSSSPPGMTNTECNRCPGKTVLQPMSPSFLPHIFFICVISEPGANYNWISGSSSRYIRILFQKTYKFVIGQFFLWNVEIL